MKSPTIAICVWLFLCPFVSFAQTDTLPQKVESPKKWYENVQIRGYAQVRYNRLLETNPLVKCEQCDRSIGEGGTFFLRRMRIIFFGQINPRVYFYVQPDFASSASATGLHFAQLRDAYFDVGIDKDNEFRFRIGQSKIPFGFENLQSSQNRLPLDRHDALNSALSNERDPGVFFYWAPKHIRKQFSGFVRYGLKGSGDYGVFAVGAYTGQTANRPELNNRVHVVSRVAYPINVGGQTIEPSVQAYTGHYTMPADQLSTGVKSTQDKTYLDARQAVSLVLYPKPFGIQAEYNIGKGPEFNPATDSIEVRNLKGGYVTLNYMARYKDHLFYPFMRYHTYEGGKKHERDARSYRVKELEIGVEWQPFPQFELVAMYTISDRRFEDFQKQDNRQKGNLLRLQAQVNF
jgi:Phosphate-selective porin O and P